MFDLPFTITGIAGSGRVVEFEGCSFGGVAIRRPEEVAAEDFETEAATFANDGLGRSGDSWVVAMMEVKVEAQPKSRMETMWFKNKSAQMMGRKTKTAAVIAVECRQ